MEILKRVIIRTLLIILPATVLSFYFIEPQKVPMGIFTGWLLGLINLRQLARNVEGFLGSGHATLKLLLMSMTRLLFIFAAVFVLIYYKVVNIFGLLFGFTVVFTFILIEGAKVAKADQDKEPGING